MKVVTSLEMGRIEQWAIDRGSDPKLFMEQAGAKVAARAREMVPPGKRVVLLIGKGNKGGYAYVAGSQLLKWGYHVRVCPLFPPEECSELNRLFSFPGNLELDFSSDDLIIDGLLGTGFYGQVEGALKEAIEKANGSKKPILAIDIPSGINGTTGQIGGCAIKATATVALGLPKCGLFLQDGWNCTGTLFVEDFGLPVSAVEEAVPQFFMPDSPLLALPQMNRMQNKYSRGFVLGFGGSIALKGALKLSCKAALHSGAGIVKAFGLEEIGPTEDELIFQIWDQKNWQDALAKAQAVFVGPGLGRSDLAKQWLITNLGTIKQPCIIDADALFFLPTIDTWPKTSILTPHRGEMLHLLGESRLEQEELLKRCAAYAEKKQVILLLKGAPSFVFSPSQPPYILHRGDPGMATAGSGDVLTGIITALLAQGKAPLEATLLGVTLHGLSGESASKEKTSYSYSAADLITHLPQAFQALSKS